MSITPYLWATLASSTGLSYTEVSEIGRRIRERKLFTRHTKSKKSQVITDRDLANLTIAVMSGLPAQHTHIAVTRLSDAEIENGDHKHLKEVADELERLGEPLAVFLERSHTFADGLTALYALARRSPDEFRQTFAHTHLTIDQKRFTGEIYLTAQAFRPMAEDIVDAILNYAPAEDFFRGDMRVSAWLGASTIAAVAAAANTESR